MRAVFSATRRSLTRRTMVLMSPRWGARNISRSVSMTGTQHSSKRCAKTCFAACVVGVIAWAPDKIERGSRHPGLPLFGAQSGPPVRLDAGGPSYDPPYYCAAASDIERTETNTRPLVLVWNSTLPLINANNV